jgi:hypothetical protein
MANSIDYAAKFLPVVDEIYKAESVTENLDSNSMPDFTGANEIKVLKVSTTGLGNYSRTNGYPKGDVTASWETLKLSQERGKEISVDRMDDEETLGMVFGKVTGNFMREWVVPELDAYRFAKYASAGGIGTDAATITKDNILTKIDDASMQMDEAEVPQEGRILFVSSDLKPAFNGALSREWTNENEANTVVTKYNNMSVIYVPKTRFYTGITLNDGASSWGYAKADTAMGINFMMIYPESIVQAKKFAMPKVFSPDENQKLDAWLFQFRLYHDAFVYENRAKGIFMSKKEA